MSTEIYELASLALRYWFLFLLFVIVIRMYIWFYKDLRVWRNYVKNVPSAGHVGEMHVVFGNDNIKEGMVIEISKEGIIGTKKNCDINLYSKKIAKRAVYFRMEDGMGLYLEPIHKTKVLLNNERINKSSDRAYAVNGSYIQIEDILLRCYFYSGYSVPTLSDEYVEEVENSIRYSFIGDEDTIAEQEQ